MVKRIFPFLLCALFLSGCLTVQEALYEPRRDPDDYRAGVGQSREQLRGEVARLQERLQNLEEENSQLREELVAREKKVAVLRKEKKEAVKMPTALEIQTALNNAGFYEGKIDGKIGPKTKGAIQKFQQVYGLKADGVVGSQTWEKLYEYLY